MEYVSKAITNTISISQFNKGLAGQIFADVKRDGAKVVMKNNTAEAVIVSPDEYVEIVEALNDYELFATAVERMNSFDPSALVSEEEMMARFGISEEDLKDSGEVDIL